MYTQTPGNHMLYQSKVVEHLHLLNKKKRSVASGLLQSLVGE